VFDQTVSLTDAPHVGVAKIDIGEVSPGQIDIVANCISTEAIAALTPVWASETTWTTASPLAFRPRRVAASSASEAWRNVP